MSLYPGSRLVAFAAVFLGASVAFALLGVPGVVLGGAAAAAALVALVDALAPAWRAPLGVERETPENAALGVPFDAALVLVNGARSPRAVSVFEGLPLHVSSEDMPLEVVVPGESRLRVPFQLVAERRGVLPFRTLDLLSRSRLGLWVHRRRVDVAGSVRVLPNHRPVLRYSLLAVANRQEQSGIRRRQRRGQGTSFHQLREYRDDDLPQQIDWKATARRQRLISREYEEERDQRVVILIDRSRRMAVRSGDCTLLDHALNASLLLSYVALEQGDRVSALGFSGDVRWVPPVKGKTGMRAILYGTHDWQTTTAPSDFLEAARRTLVLEPRRALVVLVTSLRGEDVGELRRAVESLSRRHLVVVASLREPAVEAALAHPLDSFDAVLAGLGATHYEEERRTLTARLRDSGVRVLDVRPDELATTLATAYLDVKGAGAL